MGFNALRINPKKGIIEDIKLKKLEENCIEKSIKKFSFLPIILEKIFLDCDTGVTMLTEIKDFKRDKSVCFYYKGYPICSSAVIAKSSLTSSVSYPFIQYSPIDDLMNVRHFLNKKVVFSNSKDIPNSKRIQIETIEVICKCGVNPFDIITFHDKKFCLKTLRIIDVVDTLVSSNVPSLLEMLKGMVKTLKVIDEIGGKTLSEKNKMCISMLQRTCNKVCF